MPRTFDQVALIKIVRPDPNTNQILNQLPLNIYTVIDSCKQNRLIAKRNSSPGEFITRLFKLSCNLIGVINVNIHP